MSAPKISSPAPAAGPTAENADDAFPQIEAVLEAMGPVVAPEVKQTFGLVEAIGPMLSVRVGPDLVSAVRAASCLLDPSVGDRVLVALSDRASFVLAVLVRARSNEQPGVLSVDGDLTLKSNTGKVAIVANDTVSITSGNEVALTAPELSVRSLKTTIFSESLAYVGRKIDSEVERIKLVAQVLDSAVDRVSARLKRSFRTVEEIEQVKAKEMDVVVEGNVSVHGENALVSADKLVKLDGEQVHLG